ncbi:MAG: hypothetical protein IPG25_16250 [Proteobacteria bacterium]|nr:hypothetical protein [Pseudomonadota bacterium]
MNIDQHALIAQRRKQLDRQYKAFINEVAKTANELQAQQPDLSRSEAIRVAEIMVARANAEKS